ncbi:MAG: cytochrome c [Ectothiorhodospiraceae bacterium]|nr:cytochrome c [Ectothiorhodospiraceae bacterium]
MSHTIIVTRTLVLMLLLLTTAVVMAGDPMKGRLLYENRCQGCHGAEGVPQVAGMPNFKMGTGLMQPDEQLLAFVKKGKGVMPGFKGILTDTEIRNIIAHVRTFF